MKKTKKGFTLIELLAVIVILAIIALIASPIILNVIDESRNKANMNSAYGLVDATRLYYAENVLKGNVAFDENGEAEVLDSIKYSGTKPTGGTIKLNKKGEISLSLEYDNKCYVKGYDEAKIAESDCDGSTGEEEVIEDTKKDKLIADDTDGALVQVGNDLRYQGPNSKVYNRVMFNNQTWRILGFVNGKMKIVKETPVVERGWDSSKNNDWTTSSLQTYLNGEYYDSIDATSKSYIAPATYHLGGVSLTDETTVDEVYAMENSNNVFEGRPTELKNVNVGIMYISDYGYSMSSSCTLNPKTYGTGFTPCKYNHTWLVYDNRNEWFLAPDLNTGNSVYYSMTTSSFTKNDFISEYFYVRPTVFIKPEVKIISGDGSNYSAYQLGM